MNKLFTKNVLDIFNNVLIDIDIAIFKNVIINIDINIYKNVLIDINIFRIVLIDQYCQE